MSSTGTELTRTTVGSVTNQYKWTYSFWVKRSALGTGATNSFIFDWYQSNANRGGILFENDNTFKVYDRVSSSNALDRRTNRLFRDTNAWYHIVIAHDRSIGSPVTKIYINGVEETSFMSSTDPSQNGTSYFNTASQTERIGKYGNGNEYSQMVMSHVHFCDGYYYQASDFGSTDSTTGEWKINTSPSVSYGNNGYFILKDGNSLTDQSPNTNNFTVAGGTLTDLKDNPSNVFNVLNPLDSAKSGYTYAQSNTAIASTSSNRTYVTSTLGMASGKYYWECKLDGVNADSGGASTSVFVGITGKTSTDNDEYPDDNTTQNCVINTNGQAMSNGSNIGSAMGSGWSTSTIVMMAYDADNNKMYFGKDGTWLNSGDPTSGSTGTGAFTPTTAIADTSMGVYMPTWGVNFNASYGTSFNFGNGYFGTTAISSAGTNASNLGIFEHDVPSGYSALCTKGLNL